MDSFLPSPSLTIYVCVLHVISLQILSKYFKGYKLKKDQSMALMMKNNPYEYTKMEKEDPQDLSHTRAQFLIQKVLERADHKTRQQQRRKRSSGPLIMIRVVGIRMRIGTKLRKLRKNNTCVCTTLISRFLKPFKRFWSSSPSSPTISDLSPLFSLQD
ncbi:hypothetical protein Bca4012_019767 [Brassica carinata]